MNRILYSLLLGHEVGEYEAGVAHLAIGKRFVQTTLDRFTISVPLPGKNFNELLNQHHLLFDIYNNENTVRHEPTGNQKKLYIRGNYYGRL